MLVAASVMVAGAACGATPGLGTDDEPEVIPHSQSAPTTLPEPTG
jgi:hypothetical protein